MIFGIRDKLSIVAVHGTYLNEIASTALCARSIATLDIWRSKSIIFAGGVGEKIQVGLPCPLPLLLLLLLLPLPPAPQTSNKDLGSPVTDSAAATSVEQGWWLSLESKGATMADWEGPWVPTARRTGGYRMIPWGELEDKSLVRKPASGTGTRPSSLARSDEAGPQRCPARHCGIDRDPVWGLSWGGNRT